MIGYGSSFIRTVTLGLLAAIIGCSAPDVDEITQSAAAFAASGRHAEAVIQYKAALAQAPERGDIRFALARVYLEIGEAGGAEKELAKAFELGHRDARARSLMLRALLQQRAFQRAIEGDWRDRGDPEPDEETRAQILALEGHAHLARGEIEAAESKYEAALTLSAKEVEALIGKARAAAQQDDLGEARSWLARARDVDPDSPHVSRDTAALELREGHFDAAEAEYTAAIEQSYNNAVDIYSRFSLRFQQGNLDGAASDLELLTEKLGQTPLTVYASGILAFAHQDYDTAATAFANTLSKWPDFVPALVYAGITNYLLGKFEQANMQLTNSYQRTSNWNTVARALSVVRLRLGDYVGAREFAEQVLARDPDDELALGVIGQAALARGETEEGLAALGRLVTKDPEAVGARTRLGIGLLEQGELQRGFDHLQAAANLDAPTSGVAHGALVFNYIQQGQFDEARDAAMRAIQAMPDNPLGANLLGGVELSRGDHEAAKAAFSKALEISPGDPSAAHNLANLALLDGDIAAARHYIDSVLAHYPQHKRSVVVRAELDFAEGRHDAAIAALRTLLSVQPDADEVRLALGRTLAQIGDLSGALKELEPMLAQHQNHVELHGLVAEIHLTRNEPARAAKLLERVLERHPDAAAARFLLARSYALLGRQSDARNELRRAHEAGSRNPAVRLGIARLLIELGDLDAARTELDVLKSNARQPDSPAIQVLEAMLAMAQGDNDAAITALETGLQIQPEHRESVLLLARALARKGNRKASIAQLEAWLERMPMDAQAHFQLANVYTADPDTVDRAKAKYLTVLDYEPDHITALNNLAWLLRERQPRDALVHAERAAELGPGSPSILDTFGVILSMNNEHQRALGALRRASALQPNSQEIRLHLAEAQLRAGDTTDAKQTLGAIVELDGQTLLAERAREILARLP